MYGKVIGHFVCLMAAVFVSSGPSHLLSLMGMLVVSLHRESPTL